MGNPSQSYRASPAIWDHTVLPATWCRWMLVVQTDGRLSWAQCWLVIMSWWFTPLPTVQSSIQVFFLIVIWPGV